VVSAVRDIGSQPTRTAFRSPWQNGVAERNQPPRVLIGDHGESHSDSKAFPRAPKSIPSHYGQTSHDLVSRWLPNCYPGVDRVTQLVSNTRALAQNSLSSSVGLRRVAAAVRYERNIIGFLLTSARRSAQQDFGRVSSRDCRRFTITLRKKILDLSISLLLVRRDSRGSVKRVETDRKRRSGPETESRRYDDAIHGDCQSGPQLGSRGSTDQGNQGNLCCHGKEWESSTKGWLRLA
jgi:hypothetical protein